MYLPFNRGDYYTISALFSDTPRICTISKKPCTLLFVFNRLSRGVARLTSRAHKAEHTAFDLRSLGPIHVCSCGSKVFKVGCMFEDNEISLWFTDAQCAECGSLVKVPTPVDND